MERQDHRVAGISAKVDRLNDMFERFIMFSDMSTEEKKNIIGDHPGGLSG